MKKIIHSSLIVLFLIAGVTLGAQGKKVEKANKQFDKLSFINATDIYLKVAESGYESEELFQNLGDSYYFNSNYEEASNWYGKLFKLEKDQNINYLLRYSQTLKYMGEDAKAKTYYDLFLSKVSNGQNKLTAQDYIDRISANSDRFSLKPTTINSETIDFGSAKLQEKYLVFSSTRDTGTIIKRRHSWNNLAFSDLYQAPLGEDGSLGTPEKLKGDVNTKHHETSAVFTNSGETMYFTRNNTTPNSKTKDIQRLKIYRATRVNDKWENIEDLSINSDTYSTAHPALSPDNKTLYYVSNQPGGKGQTDIYFVPINSNGSLGNPRNMGDFINTSGRESFPYVTSTNELYFSSDGHLGLGAYDVFYTNLNAKNPELLNVGEPVNSSFDDIAFTIDPVSKKGYISSNRDGGMGYDDIYEFTEIAPIKSFQCAVKGVVVDSKTGNFLPNAVVTVMDINNTVIETMTTNDKGFYGIALNCDKTYVIRAEKEMYATQEVVLDDLKADSTQNFQLVKNEEKVEVGTDVAPFLELENIYFDLDKSVITPKAQIELLKVISFLRAYPTIKLEIASHTDSRGTDAYNLKLSDRRAAATRAYLINSGIASDRLFAKGYGETLLVNQCNNTTECTDNEHLANRRSEFRVTEL